MTWPLIQRNKVEDSKVNVPVKKCLESENETLASLAKKVNSFTCVVLPYILILWHIHQLLEQWEGLEYAYRIPKRLKVVRTSS